MKAKTQFLLTSLFAVAAVTANAAPTLSTGTPADSYLTKPTTVSPRFGTLWNFDELTPNTTFNPNTYSSAGLTISSPDGLTVAPYSTQSGPNELFDNSSDGTADISIKLATGTTQIGVGIADSDPVAISLASLNASGVVFGTTYQVTIDNSSANPNPGNGYYILSDTTSDIYGLEILQTLSSTSYSGMAIDDVQVASSPEPASLAIVGVGLLAVAGMKLRKKV